MPADEGFDELGFGLQVLVGIPDDQLEAFLPNAFFHVKVTNTARNMATEANSQPTMTRCLSN